MAAFEFDSRFQRLIIKYALEDDSFCSTAVDYIHPEFFESDGLQWCWKQIQSERREARTPTYLVLGDKVRGIESVIQPRYRELLGLIEQDLLREDAYIRSKLSEFIKRNMFVGAFTESSKLFNIGKVDNAIDYMQRHVEKINAVTFEPPDREWFFEELDERQRIRKSNAQREHEHTFPTGVDGVDVVLDGGLSKGELGTWMADSKKGKSLFLGHLAGYGARALQCNVLMIVLEGSRKLTADRIETRFANSISGALYKEVKRGEITPHQYKLLQEEYQQLKQRMVIRGMTNEWTYTVQDIREEINDLKAHYGWRPDMVVVDYGDLLRSRTKTQSEEEQQRQAFSDLKSLSCQDNGYAVWTASQTRRQDEARTTKYDKEKDTESKPIEKTRVVKAKDIADSYNKVRRSDFIGSINQTIEEKEQGIARLYCDLYRDNAASKVVYIKQDLEHMVFADLLHPYNRPDRPEAVLGQQRN